MSPALGSFPHSRAYLLLCKLWLLKRPVTYASLKEPKRLLKYAAGLSMQIKWKSEPAIGKETDINKKQCRQCHVVLVFDVPLLISSARFRPVHP